MSEASRGMLTGAEYNNVGPDYFGYYTRQVEELLLQDDDFLPFASQTSDLSGRKCREVIRNDTTKPSNADSLFSNSIGSKLSDLKKERLKVLLQQGVTVLSPQVNETLDPMLALVKLQSQVRKRKHPSSHTGATYDGDAEQVLHKKLKSTETPGNRTCLEEPKEKESHLESNIGFEDGNGEVDEFLQFFAENDSLEFEEAVKKYSDELSETLRQMEQQLEGILDNVMSTCRPMTGREKQQLRKLVQKLPPKDLERVVEIIRRGKMTEAQTCDEMFVNLDKEDDRTLWRLYYCILAKSL